MKKKKTIIIILLINLIIFGGINQDAVFAQATTPVQINGIFNPDSIYPSQVSRLTINVYNPNTYEVSDLQDLLGYPTPTATGPALPGLSG